MHNSVYENTVNKIAEPNVILHFYFFFFLDVLVKQDAARHSENWKSR